MRRKKMAAVNGPDKDEVNPPKAKGANKLPKSVKVLDPKTALPIIFRVKHFPEQALRDKIGRDKGLNVATSYLDLKNERFSFQIVQGIELVPAYVTFKEACEMYGWKSFSFDMNNTRIIPVWKDKGADEEM